MVINNEILGSQKEKFSPKQPHTQIGELRDILTLLETRIAKLKEVSPEDALEILSLLDQASNRVRALETTGRSASSEATQLESLERQFHGKRQIFVGKVGGTTVMQQVRRKKNPNENNWWWFIDEAITKERQSKAKKWTVGIVIAGVVLAAIVIVYQQFFAPDPTFQAGIGFQQMAENYLISGNYESALDYVNQAIDHLPEFSELLVMRGVIYEMLEEPDLAENDYELSRQGFEKEGIFYVVRSKYYLMAGLPELALLDAQIAISMIPDSAISYIYLAQAHEILGDIEKALENYEKASEIAERNNDPTLQVMARMQYATLLQQIPVPSTETP